MLDDRQGRPLSSRVRPVPATRPTASYRNRGLRGLPVSDTAPQPRDRTRSRGHNSAMSEAETGMIIGPWFRHLQSCCTVLNQNFAI